MGKARTTETASSSDTSKKKDKQAASSKSYKHQSDSDSELQQEVYPGTHWPLDATLELYINYDAVKEIRAVKPDFYPMLFHLTKSDYSSVARALSKLPVIMDNLQARLDKMKGQTATSAEVKSTQPPKAVTPPVVKDLETAKKEVLKLLSNMTMNQNDVLELLDWIKTLVSKKKGRTGYHLCEQEKDDEHLKPLTRTQSKAVVRLVPCNIQTISDSKTVMTRAQEKNETKTEVKNDNKCPGTTNVKKHRKDASPIDDKKRPTREEVCDNIKEMAAAQILSQAENINKKQINNCTKDKLSNDKSPQDKIGTRKRGRPRKNLREVSGEDHESTHETMKKQKKTKSHRSTSPAVSLPSPGPPVLSPQTTISPSKFSLSTGTRENVQNTIKSVLNSKQQQAPPEVVEKVVPERGEWSQQTTQPVSVLDPPARNNFGPIPMCLYKVQPDSDVSPMDSSLDLVTPKIEIDNAEDDVSFEQCYLKREPGPSVESSVSASGITQKLAPIIKTICTGSVCGGDNCIHEHSVIVEDCDNPELDCVLEKFGRDAKEAEPIIIIDDI
ncbi:uncharacterized protein LOC132549704 [Ylistrum balloti]|uniref:uncharacterized protein LOC132549704 n=1 Tax=Ylistrum balloti TaxID=509963 RepID=UPI002905A025|nr:uncharacterized protein LOC132549704 [Ylistrum balloti]XP_060069640.1 uncharacterized protein LOC132549704 [Ylistrum balloti]XP_060069641.1 uncharacterized protein LOC132549704 [Ylistrum balloti]